MARILVVEDEIKLLQTIQRRLEADGYGVVAADNGEDGYRLAATGPVDAVILDLMLPRRDGLQVLRDLRAAGFDQPILVLTARDAVEDRVAGLDAGADDYLVKPFAYAELVARLRVLLRRVPTRQLVLRAGDLEMDVVARRVARGGTTIHLTQREFETLEYLLRRADIAVTREMLARDVWHEPGGVLTNAIDVCINGLRRKLDRPGAGSLIHTVRGVGYRLSAGPGSASAQD